MVCWMDCNPVSFLDSRVYKSAARAVTCSLKHNYMTPILQDLHWLPIQECIIFTVRFRRRHGDFCMSFHLDIFSYLVKSNIPMRSLRSAYGNLLVVPNFKQWCFGHIGVSYRPYATPRLWNSLPLTVCGPQTLTHLKKRLKITHTHTHTHTYLLVYICPMSIASCGVVWLCGVVWCERTAPPPALLAAPWKLLWWPVATRRMVLRYIWERPDHINYVS